MLSRCRILTLCFLSLVCGQNLCADTNSLQKTYDRNREILVGLGAEFNTSQTLSIDIQAIYFGDQSKKIAFEKALALFIKSGKKFVELYEEGNPKKRVDARTIERIERESAAAELLLEEYSELQGD